MKVTAVLTRASGRWLAHCEEVDLAAEGDTPEQAVAALRDALREYFGHAEAVAPPAEQPESDVEIELIGAPKTPPA
jgi:predicted RNase H-like HicB family nuclease